MQPSKNVTYNEYVHGDFDGDGIRNIDDKYPFDKKRSEQVQEVSLSDELRAIRSHNLQFRKFVKFIKNKFKGRKIEYRIKGTHSTIGKLRRKYLNNLQDIIGIKILCKDQADIKSLAERIKSEYFVISDQDYYNDGKEGNKYYKARHITVRIHGKPVEIQLKTKGHSELHLRTHPLYKKYGTIPPNKYRKLLQASREITEREG